MSTGDCNMRNFTFVTKAMLPFAKLTFGIKKPWKARVLGTELAGEVRPGASARLQNSGLEQKARTDVRAFVLREKADHADLEGT